MDWETLIRVSPYLINGLVIFMLSLYSWHRRAAPGAKYFAFYLWSATIWIAGETLSLLFPNWYLLMGCIGEVGVVALPLMWLMFALEFNGFGKWASKKVFGLLAIAPLAHLLIFWRYSYDQWLGSGLKPQSWLYLNVMDFIGQMAALSHTLYAYILLLIGTLLMVQGLWRSFRMYRGQFISLMFGALAPWAAQLVEMAGLNPFSSLDVMAYSLFISSLATAWGVYRFQLFEILPVALDAVVDNIRDGVVVLNTSDQVVMMNRAARRILKCEDKNILNCAFCEITPSGGLPFADYLQQEHVHAEFGLGEGANQSWYEVHISPLRDRRNNVTGRIILMHNITQRKSAEAEIIKAKEAAELANRAKSTFLANMSHELRTPLNAVIGYSEMLQDDAADLGCKEIIPDLKKIRSAGRHLLDLINNVLDISKIEAGKMELYPERFDISDLLDNTTSMIMTLIEKKHNKLVVDCDPKIGSMVADQTKTRQVLFNLLSNAAKFTENGTITLSVRREQIDSREWIVFRISDTGIGMTPEEKERVFEPFTQADASTTRKFGGTGLGLTICVRFCEMLGGQISAESEKGKGSTFTVRLPAVMAHKGEGDFLGDFEPAFDRAEKEEADASSGVVLIIDNDPDSSEIVARVVEKEGFRARIAMSGHDGLLLAKEVRPQVIVLDVIMPEMDGWEVLSALKADEELAAIPVVMLSILSDKKKGFMLGASEYLVKPLDHKRLAATLNDYRSRAAETKKHHMSHILVVEDDPSMRELLVRTLQRDNWSVLEAENGQVALNWVRQASPDLVLLDLMLPVMDGFQFLDELRREAKWRATPVVVFTAKTLTPGERAFLSSRVSQILDKGSVARQGDDLLQEVRDMVASLLP